MAKTMLRKKSVKILVVDDEADIRKMVGDIFSPPDYRCREAGSGEEALLEVWKEKPDLVILDYKLTGMNGLETLSRLEDEIPGLPVIILTAYGDEEVWQESLKRKAYDLLPKPFKPDILKALVQHALAERGKKTKEV